MPKPRVVIVEDEPIVAFDLKRQLTKEDFDVLTICESGEEILEFLRRDVPDVILMDIRLFGDRDGIDTAREINQQYDIPILFLTANTDQETFRRAKLTFPHGFLSKPFRIKDVVYAITLALESQPKAHKVQDDSSIKYLGDRVFVRKNEFLHKVMFHDILFIEADRAYCKIVTEKESFTLSQTLKRLEDKIEAPYLIRVHRSFIANVRNVDKMTEGFLHIGQHRVPVSRAHRDEITRYFHTF